MRQRRSSRIPDANINITSLLDITFVLLISFMVVAPAIRYNVDLELPKVSESKSTDKKKPVTVLVTNKNRPRTEFYVNGRQVTADTVADTIKGLPEFDAKQSVALEADKGVPWEDIARLINQLRLKGIDSIGIITEKSS